MIAFTAQNWLVPDLGSQLALILFGLGMGVLYLLPGLLVGGAAWATMARALNRIVERRQLTFEHRAMGISFARGALVALGSAILVAGLVIAVAGRPGSTRCLDVGGDVPHSGAWSPDGSLLAIASSSDPNRIGHVRLFRWPSGELIARGRVQASWTWRHAVRPLLNTAFDPRVDHNLVAAMFVGLWSVSGGIQINSCVGVVQCRW
jgi:hypothetical protein